MKLKDILKDSWRLTKSNFVTMMCILSIGTFLSVLAITPFVGETPGMTFLDGWSGIVFWATTALVSSVMIQFGFLAVSQQDVRTVSKVLLAKNIGLVFAFQLVFSLLSNLMSLLPVWISSLYGELYLFVLIQIVTVLISVFISIRFSFFSYYVVGYDLGFKSALKAAWRLSGRKWAAMLGIGLILVLGAMLGAVVFIVGVFVTMIIATFASILYFNQWSQEESLIQNKIE